MKTQYVHIVSISAVFTALLIMLTWYNPLTAWSALPTASVKMDNTEEVTLLVVNNNQPSFRAAKWNIYNVRTGTLLYSSQGHMKTTRLASAENYRAFVEIDEQVHIFPFTVQAGQSNEVIFRVSALTDAKAHL